METVLRQFTLWRVMITGAFVAALLASCERQEGQSAKVLMPTRFEYGYGGDLGRYGIADDARAFSGQTLVGKAQSIELQHSPTGGPSVLKIEVTHFSVSERPIYRGYVFIQAGFGGGKLIREEDISGSKDFTIFDSWEFGY